MNLYIHNKLFQFYLVAREFARMINLKNIRDIKKYIRKVYKHMDDVPFRMLQTIKSIIKHS